MFINDIFYENDIKAIVELDLSWKKLENQEILITGASGMIGTVLVDVLMKANERYDLNINIKAVGRNVNKAKERFACYWDMKNFYFIKADINKPLNLSSPYKLNYIIHAASNTHPIQYSGDPIGTITTNFLGTKNLLDLAVGADNKKFVLLSSVEVYGRALNKDDVFAEDYCGYIDCNTLRAGYPEGKRVSEALCQAYKDTYDINVVIPRLSRVYGPSLRLDDSKAMSQFIMRAVTSEDIVLKSEGLQRFSYIHAADAVSGILYVMLSGKDGEAYNVSGDENLQLKEIAEILARKASNYNKKCKVVFDLPNEEEKRGFSTADIALMNNSKLKQLGWYQRKGLEKGIYETIMTMRRIIKG